MPTDNVDYAAAEGSIPVNALPFGVVTWGDSLTSGLEGYYDQAAYPEELGNLLVLPVVNDGVSGDTSTQCGVREGGVPTYATVAGGVIPAYGSVNVSFPKGYEPITIRGPAAGTPGTILGVHGIVTIDPTGTIYTFTATTPGNAVNAPGSPQFYVDTPYSNYIPIFWEGRDNYLEQPTILSDLAAQVATVPTGQNYLILGVTNVNRKVEWIGGIAYNVVVKLNAQLAAIYGSHFIDIRKVLVDSYNPALITDVSDYQHDEVPTSLRGVYIQSATLANAIGPSDTIVTLNTDIGVGVQGIITIDTGDIAENVVITAVNGNTYTVIRDFGGNNTSHAADAPIQSSDPVHLNAQGYQIVANAVAQYLSAYDVPK